MPQYSKKILRQKPPNKLSNVWKLGDEEAGGYKHVKFNIFKPRTQWLSLLKLINQKNTFKHVNQSLVSHPLLKLDCVTFKLSAVKIKQTSSHNFLKASKNI